MFARHDHRKHGQICFAVATLLAVTAWQTTAHAQVRRYTPSRPTVSPYLNLTRTNNGVLPNYYSLVRPQQLQQELNHHEAQLRHQQAGQITNLRNEVQVGLAQVAPTGTAGQFQYGGTHATYQRRSGYYLHPSALHRPPVR